MLWKFMARGLVGIMATGLAACTIIPTGPSRMSLPGTGKSLEQFRVDDIGCRQYALENSGATPQQVQEASGVKSAVVGTAIGAAAGAALGGSGRSAAAGAGAGLIVGSAAGIGAGQQSSYLLQRRYDDAYTQCMYAKGHRVAIPAGAVYTPQSPPAVPYPPPPAGLVPPPPASILR